MSNILRRSQQRMQQTRRQCRERANGKAALGPATTFSCISLLHTTRLVYTQFTRVVTSSSCTACWLPQRPSSVSPLSEVAPTNQGYVVIQVWVVLLPIVTTRKHVTRNNAIVGFPVTACRYHTNWKKRKTRQKHAAHQRRTAAWFVREQQTERNRVWSRGNSSFEDSNLTSISRCRRFYWSKIRSETYDRPHHWICSYSWNTSLQATRHEVYLLLVWDRSNEAVDTRWQSGSVQVSERRRVPKYMEKMTANIVIVNASTVKIHIISVNVALITCETALILPWKSI